MDARTAVAGGVGLGAVVVAWQVASIGADLTALFVPVATLVQLVALGGVLAKTRAQSYGLQVATGLVVSAVASAMIFVGCLVCVWVLFPDALPPEAPGALVQAVAGVVGTMVTGLVASALMAIGLRS